jgi:hypothetical protein
LEYGAGVVTTNGGGREDGYMNVSLGNDGCDDYQYQEEGCEPEEFEQVLGCCSMLDNDSDDDEDDEEEDVECVSPTSNNIDGVGQEKEGGDDDDNDKGNNNAETVVVVEERDHSGVNDECVGSNDNNIIGEQKRQQSDGCWQQTNPTLDMMLYRQFLNE